MSRVLVISPHPDDEAIGCGGTLRKHVTEGDAVSVVFLTSGEKGGHGKPVEATRRQREQEARVATAILGIKQVEFWGEPDGALRASETVARRLRQKLKEARPKILYVTHPVEMHRDHQAAARLVRRALASNGAARMKPAVMGFEVWTPIQRIDSVVDISAFIKIKLAAVRAYESQCAVMGFDEAVLGLNRYRGEMHSWPGGEYAEIFTRLDI